jgi:hypothetical protein
MERRPVLAQVGGERLGQWAIGAVLGEPADRQPVADLAAKQVARHRNMVAHAPYSPAIR